MNQGMRTAVTSLLAAIFAVISTTVWAQVIPQNGGVLLPHIITINNQPGDQFDPHVDGDLAVYSNIVSVAMTSGFTQDIQYYRFLTGTDATVPTDPSMTDLLSDVDQGRIAFTRIFPSGFSSIMLFDTATSLLQELAPSAAGSNRIGVALGGQTVAFVDFGLAGDGSSEIVVVDPATSAVTRLTNDTAHDYNPAVSPDGNVVVWQKCSSITFFCHIYRALRSGTTWNLQVLAPTALMDGPPDSDGVNVVFQREDFNNLSSPTGSNIVIVPVTGGPATELLITGEQYNPSMRGSIVVFESRVRFGNPDLYLYDRASNKLFQITQTSGVVESLNDVTILPTGEVRVVWEARDTFGWNDPNIYAATFTLPGAPQCVRGLQLETHVSPGLCLGFTGIPTPVGIVDMLITAPSFRSSFVGQPTVGNNFPNVPGINFPVGTLSFTALLPADMEGGDMTIALTFTPQLDSGLTQLFKVVDTLGTLHVIDPARWSRTDTATTTIITLTLTDGLFPLDLDATANRVIVDPLAIGVMPNQPPVANAGTDQNLYLGQTAALDGAASSDADGDALTYRWTLGAAPTGSSAVLVGANTMSPALTPDRAGAYHLSLVVNDGQVDSAASPVVIHVSLNLPPVASATGAPTSGNVPVPVQFNADASHDPEGSLLSYSWDFGDPDSGAENVSDEVNPLHSYATAGRYTAVLTVTDAVGKTDQASVAVIATAPNLPPVVLPTALPNNGAAPLGVHFAAHATDVNPDDVMTYHWDFGDPESGADNVSTQANPTHTYLRRGTYSAVVSVSDGVNSGVSANLTISVNSALTIQVTQARVQRGEKGKVEGKISMKADFDFAGELLKADLVRVTFDGVSLLDVPFGLFKPASNGRQYEYQTRALEAEIDFDRRTIKVSRHKMLTSGVDNSNGIDVEISFGAATGTDHAVMTRERDKHDSDLSHKR